MSAIQTQSNDGSATPLLDRLPQLGDWMAGRGHSKFRACQVLNWIFERRIGGFSAMTNLPMPLRTELACSFSIFTGKIENHHSSRDGTEKLVLRLSDGGLIECVLLREANRRTICVSSQVGCAMGCVFCASGLDGVMRNLTAGEILEQMLLLQQLLAPDERLSHIVMMGMGEPLANLDHVLTALQRATAADGLGISPRRVTISTVGLPAAIRKLASLDCRFHLAVSLHAANDSLRNELVPVNRKVGLRDLLEAADHYFHVSGRRLTFEYVLLRGVNDRPQHALELADLLRQRTALLNIIPYNPVAGLPYETPSPDDVRRFRETLESRGVVVKIRRRKGDKINAACGQLRRQRQTLSK